MPADEHFIQAILENPDDEATRLVYADWLEDRDDPRSEFMRIQLKRYKVSRRNPWFDRWHWHTYCETLWEAGDWGRHRTAFIEMQMDLAECSEEASEFTKGIEEDRLLDEQREEWVGDIGNWVEEYEFQRGLLERVKATPQQLLEHADLLFHHAPILDVTVKIFDDEAVEMFVEMLSLPQLAQIRNLHLVVHFPNGTEIANALAQARHLSRLTSLWLEMAEIGDEGLEQLAQCPHLGQLRELHLEGNQITEEGIRALSQSPYWQHLDTLFLGSHSIGDEGAELLANWPGLRRVRTLDLADGDLDVGGIAALANSRHTSRITTLCLDYNLLSEQGVEALANARSWNKLTTLDLFHTNLDVEGVKKLGNSETFSRLTALRIGGNRFRTEGVVALAQSPALTNLQALDLSWTPLRGAGLAALFSSPYLHSLTWLDLSRNGIDAFDLESLPVPCLVNVFTLDLRLNPLGDEGVELLARWPGMTNVTILHLKETEMGDAGAEELTHSQHLGCLCILDARGNALTEKGKTTLRQFLGDHCVWLD